MSVKFSIQGVNGEASRPSRYAAVRPVRNSKRPSATRRDYRGWGLQFGSLQQFVEGETLFREALRAATSLESWISSEKRANLYLILTRFLPRLIEKNIIEFGAFKGDIAVFMTTILREVAPTSKIYALDTFNGMPVTDNTIDDHNAGDFSDCSLEALQDKACALGLTNLVPVSGLFQTTFPNFPVSIKFGLAHIDADIYESIKYAQDAVWPRMTKGGYLVYDDVTVSSCIGTTEAVEEFIKQRHVHCEQSWPHFVFRVGLVDSSRKPRLRWKLFNSQIFR
jgi:Macrocin-O-methyltransferase (TylF)